MEMIKNSLAKSLLSATIAATFAVPMAAHATNGYFLPGYGAKSVGMGGVGVAYPQDSLSAAANPAGIAGMGFRADIGLEIFSPRRKAGSGASAGSSGPIGGSTFGFDRESTSWNNYFPIPSAGFTMDFDDRLSIGMAMVANGGMNSTYGTNNLFQFNAAGKNQRLGVDMMQLLVPITVAYKVDNHNAVGVSLVPAISTFKANGLQSFAAFQVPNDPAQFTNNGRDNAHGAGVRVGWLGKYFDDRVSFGASYASKVYMSKFKRYSGLFAEGGGFDIPANYTFGIALKPIKSVTIAFDRERILYGDIKSVHNRGPGDRVNGVGLLNGDIFGIPALAPGGSIHQTGNPDGMGFGWNSQTVYKFGMDYKYNESWTYRIGYNYGHTPIPNDQLTFNILAPATVEKHYMAGFTYSPDKTSEITFGLMIVPKVRQSNCAQNIVNCVYIEMNQRAMDLSYAIKF